VDKALGMIVERVRAEEAITNRILGLTSGGVDLLGPPEVIHDMMTAWSEAIQPARPGGAAASESAVAT